MMARNCEVLADVARSMAPFSLDYTAGILQQYMQLFCDSVRLLLLLRHYPGKLVVQLYSLVHSHAKLRDKTTRQQELTDRMEMVQLVSSCDMPVKRLQDYFRSITPRISQVSDSILLLSSTAIVPTPTLIA